MGKNLIFWYFYEIETKLNEFESLNREIELKDDIQIFNQDTIVKVLSWETLCPRFCWSFPQDWHGEEKGKEKEAQQSGDSAQVSSKLFFRIFLLAEFWNWLRYS
jgi:hypothetical protein